MLLKIPNLLTSDEVADCRRSLDEAEWRDGRATARGLAHKVKNNAQVPDDHPVAKRLGEMVLAKLDQNPLFKAAALPNKIVPPRFNRYEPGQYYGSHIDSAIRKIAGESMRADLSATVFLSAPDEYDGGELIIEDAFDVRTVKLEAGDMILYPANTVHHVEPVTRGARWACFFWVQSLVRDDGDRTMLLQLDVAGQKIARALPNDLTTQLQMSNVYHNLLRRWSDT
jgi:PKHD-type hydroxylase